MEAPVIISLEEPAALGWPELFGWHCPRCNETPRHHPAKLNFWYCRHCQVGTYDGGRYFTWREPILPSQAAAASTS